MRVSDDTAKKVVEEVDTTLRKVFKRDYVTHWKHPKTGAIFFRFSDERTRNLAVDTIGGEEAFKNYKVVVGTFFFCLLFYNTSTPTPIPTAATIIMQLAQVLGKYMSYLPSDCKDSVLLKSDLREYVGESANECTQCAHQRTLPKLKLCLRCYWLQQIQLSCFIRMYHVQVASGVNLQPYVIPLEKKTSRVLPSAPGFAYPVPWFNKSIFMV